MRGSIVPKWVRQKRHPPPGSDSITLNGMRNQLPEFRGEKRAREQWLTFRDPEEE